MGFDISAHDDDGAEVAYLRTHMGGFRMLNEQGYDWFMLIDAYDCYGGVSGTGESKRIDVRLLRNALYILEIHDPEERLAATNPLQSDLFGDILRTQMGDKLNESSVQWGEKQDYFSQARPNLRNFMVDCIKWCQGHGKDSIDINFA